jgi:hypothetical protein
MDKFLLSNTNGDKSLTATMFVIAFIVAIAKLLLSGMTIYGFNIPVFTASEFAMVMASAGAIYSIRRYNDSKTTETKE